MPDKRLVFVKPLIGRRARKGKAKRGAAREPVNVPGRFFRRIVGRASLKLPKEQIFQPTGGGAKPARNVGWARHLRFYWKLFRRHVRRFHARFTIGQILGFYLGIPALASLALCYAILSAKPPPSAAQHGLSSHGAPPVMELIQQIQSAMVAHDSSGAKAAVSELEEFYPEDPRTFIASGTLAAQEKKYDEARKSYLHALEMVPGLLPALINLGEIEFVSGNYAQAVGYYERAAKPSPRNPLILFRCYLCYTLLDDRENAEDVTRQLVALPNSLEWYYVRASQALRAGNKPEAQRLIAAAGAMFGEQAEAYQESLRKIGWLK